MATFSLFNDIKRVVRSARLETENITTIFGDVKLDLTQTPLERGEHTLRIVTIFGNIELRLPEQIGLQIHATTLFSEVKVETIARNAEEKPGGNWISENFDQAPVRVSLLIQGLLGDIDLLRLPTTDAIAPAPRIDTAALDRDHMSAYMGQANTLPILGVDGRPVSGNIAELTTVL